MKAKAVVFDLDGTLLRDDKTVSEYTLKVLERAVKAGVHVIPASGRAMISMKPTVDRAAAATLVLGEASSVSMWSRISSSSRGESHRENCPR